MDRAPGLHVALLDGFRLVRGQPGGQEDLTGRLPRGVRRLVARLCLAGRPARAAIAGELWPELPEERAFRCLRSALWRLQRLAPEVAEVSRETVSLAGGVTVDAVQLGEWAHRVLDARTRLDDVVVPRAEAPGELLPGWYDEWVLIERERLRQLRLYAFEALAGRLAGAGRYAEAVQAAYGAVRMEPLRESAHRVLVRVHLAEGNVAEALRVHAAYRTLLADDLGIAPSPQMDALLAQAWRGDQPTTASAGFRAAVRSSLVPRCDAPAAVSRP